MKQLHPKYLLTVVTTVTMLFAGCKSSSRLDKGPNAPAMAYAEKVLDNRQTAQAVTAKMRISIKAGEKDISLSGNLKMMRNDVIQLSLSLLGIEVGRMEFTREEVLIVDRYHKQYTRVPYQQIDFLQSAQLDFNALQSIFWNEIFVPGKPDVSQALGDFRLSESGDHTLLILSTAPKLDYSFLTVTNSGQLSRTSVRPKELNNSDNLECRYSNFTKLGGKNFPQSIRLQFKGDKAVYTLDMALSSLNNNTGWETRTELSSKYTPMKADNILDKILKGF